MTGTIYGLDPGTYQLKIYDKREDRIRTVKNAVAIRNHTDIFAVGDRAYEMLEKTPGDITIAFPMKEGVISRIGEMQYLLECVLRTEEGFFTRGTEYVIAVPTDVTEMEKKAFFDLFIHSSVRAREVRIVERCIADAIGAGIDIRQTPGSAIVNLGGETTDIAILSRGGIVLNRLLKTGGAFLDQMVVTIVRRNLDFVIGRPTAEEVRRKTDVFGEAVRPPVLAAGRDLIRLRPGVREIPSTIVCEALEEFLKPCIRTLLLMLEQTPPVVLGAIRRQGICLTGGIACTKGLTGYMEAQTGVPFYTAEQPQLCAARGVRSIIVDRDFEDLAYSMKDENYRWMR